ncbi:MAG: hypothetical protein ABIR30_02810 [Chitinophagaceae bacterium]
MQVRYFRCLLICLLFDSCAFTQSLTVKESSQLELIVTEFFSNDWNKRVNYGNTAPSEALICILAIDNSGKVSSIHLLSDEKNRDSAFAIFNRMTPNDFGNWHVKKCQGKTIMIPITVSASDKPSYVKDLIALNAFKPGESQNLIIIRPLALGWPTSSH